MAENLADVNLLHQSADNDKCNRFMYIYESHKVKKKLGNGGLNDRINGNQELVHEYLSKVKRKGKEKKLKVEDNKKYKTKKIKKICAIWCSLYAITCIVRTTLYLHDNMERFKLPSKFYKSVSAMKIVNLRNYISDAERGVMDEYKQMTNCSSAKAWDNKEHATIVSMNTCNTPNYVNRGLGEINKGVTVDVLSLGYKERLEFLETQRETWASHQYVRSFWGLTEIDDMARSCETEIITDVRDHIRACKSYHDSNREGLKKFRTDLYAMTYVGKKQYPQKWLCAQSRLILGFVKLLKEYQRQSSTQFMSKVLPDYIAMVEDDTYVNMQLFGEFVNGKNSGIPITYSGCSANLGIQLGGFNLFISKGVIERMITPLTCSFSSKRKKINENSKTSNNLSVWMNVACETLNRSPLGEFDVFNDGMSLADLAYLAASKKTFCMFGGWFMKYLLFEYFLSEPTEDTGKSIHPYFEEDNCSNNGDLYCKISSHVCFWQTPESMVATTSVVYSDLIHQIKNLE